MNQLVTRATFDDAVVAGDLPTVQAYLTQLHVQEEVQATNAYVAETRPTDASRFTLSDGTLPWFRKHERSHNDSTDVPLLSAARHGHTHVLAWFFSREAVALLGGETLELLLPLVAQFDSRHVWRSWFQEERLGDLLVLETLLTSYVFCDLINDDHQKQRILDETAGNCQTPAMIEVAIAHGACVNTALPIIARCCEADCVEMLEAAGAFLVGAEALNAPLGFWDYPHAGSFLAHGVDSRGPERMLLDGALDPRDEMAVKSLLTCGFLDVDARDEDGRTALMHVANINPAMDIHPHFPDVTPEIAMGLLAFCDVNLTDSDGRTALHYAAEANMAVGAMLLANGANLTIRDHRGFAALDLLNEHSLQFRAGRELLEHLLEAGADAFAVPPTPGQPLVNAHGAHDADSRDDAAQEDPSSSLSDAELPPRSLHDRLNASERGRSFIEAHPQYFQRDGICHEVSAWQSTHLGV